MFQYNNAGSHLLSVILDKATGMNTLAFAQQYLFGPLGITSVQWDKMKDGYYDGAGLGDVCMRSVDMLKIGKLILDEGIYQGKQIIPTVWIKVVRDPAETYHTPWGFQPSRYAAFYYHYALSDEVITYGQGWGGQYLVILPREDAVIVVSQDQGTGRSKGPSGLPAGYSPYCTPNCAKSGNRGWWIRLGLSRTKYLFDFRRGRHPQQVHVKHCPNPIFVKDVHPPGRHAEFVGQVCPFPVWLRVGLVQVGNPLYRIGKAVSFLFGTAGMAVVIDTIAPLRGKKLLPDKCLSGVRKRAQPNH